MSVEELREQIESGEYEIVDTVRVQPRWKSWAVWVSVIGAMWTIASALGFTEKWGIQEGTFKTIVDSIGVILTGFGILNNPTDPDHF